MNEIHPSSGPALESFLVSSQNNASLQKHGLKVYVRNGVRCIGDQMVTTLDIASVELIGRPLGKGIFTAWLGYAERQAVLAGKYAVYVESILNDRLLTMLLARGYQQEPNRRPPSVYKLCTQLQNE